MDTQQDKNKTCQRAEELLVSQRPSISSAQLSADVLLQLGYFLLGDWWQDLHCGQCKTLHSAKHSRSIKKNLKTHSVGVPPVQLPFAG